MPTLKYGSQYVAMGSPKYKTDKQNNNSKTGWHYVLRKI